MSMRAMAVAIKVKAKIMTILSCEKTTNKGIHYPHRCIGTTVCSVPDDCLLAREWLR